MLKTFISEPLKLFCRSGRDLSIVMVDLDHFKEVNDSFGPYAGDRVLAEVAQVLLESAGRSTLSAATAERSLASSFQIRRSRGRPALPNVFEV